MFGIFLYVVGWFATSVFVTRALIAEELKKIRNNHRYYGKTRPAQSDYAWFTAFGMFTGLLWPLVAPGYLVVRLAKRGLFDEEDS